MGSQRWYLLRICLILCSLIGLSAYPTSAKVEGLSATSSANKAPIIESFGQIGGVINSVVAQGSYLYAAIGQRILVLDIIDPASPKNVGQSILLSNQIEGMAISSDVLYAAAGKAGIRIFDLSYPASPREINAIPSTSETTAISVSADLLLIADNDRLRIFDIDDAANPAEVGTYLFTCGEVWKPHFAADEKYVYLPGNSNRMEIISIADPAHPTLIGTFNAPPPSTRLGFNLLAFILLHGQYAYAMYESSGLSIIDVSDPTRPVEVAGRGPSGVAGAISYPHIYIGGPNGVRILDVSDPAQPVTYDAFGSDANLLHKGDRYLYVSDGQSLFLWDLLNPTAPELKWSGMLSPFSSPDDSVLSGENLYVLEYAGLTVFNISTPTRPIRISSYPLSYRSREMAMDGSFLYILSNGLLILDSSDPSHPIEIGSYQSPGCAFDMAVSNGFAYIADCSRGLRIVDSTDPSKPVEVGAFATPVDLHTVDVQGDYAFLPMHGGGFSVLDVSDPNQPKQVGYYSTPGNPIANDIIVHGDYAYVAEGAPNAVRIYDISDPSHPFEVRFIGLDGINAMAIQDPYLYLANYEGILVLDISDPTKSPEVGFFEAPALVLDISISGNLIGAAEFLNGVEMLRLLHEKETEVISPTGGSLVAASGTASFDVIAGAFSEPAELTYRRLFYDESSEGLLGIGRTFELTALGVGTADDAQLAQDEAVKMTLNYSEADLGPVIEDTLALYFWDGSEWVRETLGQLNTQDNQLSARVSRLGLWAILGSPSLRGDLNQDGIINALDVQLCINVAIGAEKRPEIAGRADLNGDGRVDGKDVKEILSNAFAY